jgi:hypothetical protein
MTISKGKAVLYMDIGIDDELVDYCPNKLKLPLLGYRNINTPYYVEENESQVRPRRIFVVGKDKKVKSIKIGGLVVRRIPHIPRAFHCGCEYKLFIITEILNFKALKIRGFDMLDEMEVSPGCIKKRAVTLMRIEEIDRIIIPYRSGYKKSLIKKIHGIKKERNKQVRLLGEKNRGGYVYLKQQNNLTEWKNSGELELVNAWNRL